MSSWEYLILPKSGYPTWEPDELLSADSIYAHLCLLREEYEMEYIPRDDVIDRSAMDYLERTLARGMTKVVTVTNRATIYVGLIRTEPGIDVFLSGTLLLRRRESTGICGVAAKSYLWGTLAVLEVETNGPKEAKALEGSSHRTDARA